MRDSRAILVGVDGYSFRPLDSAVNDVIAMRDTLTGIDGGEPMVDAGKISLLASPAPGKSTPNGARPATQESILDELKSYYDGSTNCDRLIFYFAGHGLAASRDGRVRQSLILPVDTAGPENGGRMICVDDLLELFAERGPREQLWIIDACRDMPYSRRPRGYEIDWNEEPPQTPRAQAAIYAVAPGGTADSEAGGHGRFTGFLIQGLKGLGSATEHIPGTGHCVTVRSLHAFARARVAKALEGYDDWTLAVQVPQLAPSGNELWPLRRVPAPVPRRFDVHVVPPEAAPAVDVRLEVEPGLGVQGWPPVAPPRIYELRAERRSGSDPQWGEPKPTLQAVDLREVDQAVVEVPRMTAPPQAATPTTDSSGRTRAVTIGRQAGLEAVAPGRRRRTRGGESPPAVASILVRSADEAATVTLTRVDGPWQERVGTANAEIGVEPGAWDIRVWLGAEVTSAARVVVAAGERREVEATAQLTPALASLLRPHMLPPAATEAGAVTPSETIGPMQGAILPTLLPLLALKPFDEENHLLQGFDGLDIPKAPFGSAGSFGAAIALEGEDRELGGLPARWLSGAPSRILEGGRIGLAIGVERGLRGTVELEITGRGKLRIATPSLPDGVTAIGASIWPDGRIDVSVGIFRLPLGSTWPKPDGYAPGFQPGRIARAIALGARQIQAGGDLGSIPMREIVEAAKAKWSDPVLGAMAFHAADQKLRAGGGDRDGIELLLEEMRTNMMLAFRDLPDTRILGMWDPDRSIWRQRLRGLLADDLVQEPVLTSTLALLADAARADDLDDHWSIERLDQLPPVSVFNATWIPARGDRP